MTKYIFHGGGVNPETGANDSFYTELMKDLPDGGTVLLVYFASRTDDNSERIAYDTETCKKFTTVENVSVNVASEENFIEEAKEADVIYLRGGSTEKLLDTLREYPNLKEVFENKNKTVAGSSAGAYALSTLYSCHYIDRAAEGLGIVPVRVVTHYESTKMPPKDGSVEILNETRTELDLIILKEGEWFVVNR